MAARSFASPCARVATRSIGDACPLAVHVIDDDDAVRDSLAFLLRTAKLDVKTYESAEAFLTALPGVNSGCIVTDVRMPKIERHRAASQD